MKQIGISVAQLAEYFNKEVEAGHGDYKVFVTDDEECNGYHSLWCLGQTAKEIEQSCGKEMRNNTEESNCDLSILEKDTDKAIYLG